MKGFYIASAVSICIFLASCGPPPTAKVNSIFDSGIIIPSPQAMTVVTDLSKIFGQKFETSFNNKYREFAEQSSKPVEFMKFIEFIRSSYNRPDANDLFPNHLFVFISTRGTHTDGYYLTSMNFLMEVKYLGKEPFLIKDIFLSAGRPYIDTDMQRGAELARAIVEELKKRNIL
jgi:hypothetical protein